VHSNIDFPKMKAKMIKLLEENGVPRGILDTGQLNVAIVAKAEEAWDEIGKPEEERAKVLRRVDEIMNEGELEAIATMEEVEGSSDAVRRLKEEGYKLAVLTRSHHEYAEEALRKFGMLECFDIVLGRGETPRPKPYAEALEHTAKLLGLGMDEIVLVGDHELDYTSASNAGCRFIGVRTGQRGDRSWGARKPDILLDSVTDVPGYLLNCERSRCPGHS
jgi:phosphoglycolate phosphatase-like HAD superfamily hydrolase